MDTAIHHPGTKAALVALIVLQTVMLAALYTGTPPHPPRAIALFALGPFLGASISVAAAAIVLGATATRAGTITAIVAALLALISFGPQKWVDPAIAEIWPSVLMGEIAAAAVIVGAIASRLRMRQA